MAERIKKYKEEKKSLSYVDQANLLAENKNEYQQKVQSQVLQETLKRLDKSFKNFFRRVKNGEKAGFPRFKAEHRFNSFKYPQSGFKLTNDNKRIYLSKIGVVRIIYSRHIIGKIKTCSVVRDVDQWFVVLTAEIQSVKTDESNKPMVGIDVGIKSFAVLSDGKVIDNPRHLKKSEKKLARTQRELSRKIKGSNNRKEQRMVVAKVHRKIRRQREDFLHKVSNQLVENYGCLVFEDLNIKGMLKNHKLAKHISDCSWNKLIQYCGYKAENAGIRIALVNPRNTSQNCSGCGQKVPKDLSIRTHECPHCGLVMDRDENASKNILKIYTSGIGEINASRESVNRTLSA